MTPGLLASKILENECRASLLPATVDYCEINPRKMYELGAKIAKAIREGTIDQLWEKVRRDNWVFDELVMYKVCVLSYCRGNKLDKFVARALQDYDLATIELHELTQKIGKFRKFKKQNWIDGKRTS
ncbi:hypothetical protein HW132_33820 [Brasilonema sp. CT11]|nr:hypothetical protein [Brasilonema sp. CT11]